MNRMLISHLRIFGYMGTNDYWTLFTVKKFFIKVLRLLENLNLSLKPYVANFQKTPFITL